MKYLIVKCLENDDPWGKERTYTPMYITDDWKSNYPQNYSFEVWEIKSDNTMKCIKEYEQSMESGMAFCYWEEEDEDNTKPAHIFKKFPNRTRAEPCPEEIYDKIKSLGEKWFDDFLKSCGAITNIEESTQRLYAYCEYDDNHYYAF